MTSNISKIAGALIATATLMAAAPALAQTSGGSTIDTNRTTTTQERGDNNRDWGWIGLLGLAGLMGLRKRDDNHTRNVTGRTA